MRSAIEEVKSLPHYLAEVVLLMYFSLTVTSYVSRFVNYRGCS